MIEEKIKPRFCETDALGHINNTVVAQWFEGARDPVFQWFIPDLSVKKWTLILARTVVDFHAELQYGESVVIKTYVGRTGNSSFDIYQEAWQQNKKCASGTATMVYFDYEQKKSQKIPDQVLQAMAKHRFNAELT
ncbi:acyl-CoA thioesterase [Colwellia sp. D2M02]|uniref:acyl-CoA thioesterase n=1 Tax=Colwellia sp. D2M02 TaxID=2841562 RepID=UPI001C099480|nr:thioesterase family protein [Colwellia sp. D2M02]MBU2894579.1 acyl-CoA thioesterase [Colwellia sp. D2M02]